MDILTNQLMRYSESKNNSETNSEPALGLSVLPEISPGNVIEELPIRP
jgi:hypothetical protein